MKQVRERITSITGTRQMTATMKVVALAKLKKKHARLLQSAPYLTEMNRMIRRLIRAVSTRQEEQMQKGRQSHLLPKLLTGNGQDQKYVVVAITSDTGLNGGNILTVLQKTVELVNYLLSQHKEVQIVSFGTKGESFLKNTFPQLPLHTLSRKVLEKEKGYLSAARLLSDLIQSFQEGRIDTCLMVYNHFENMAVQHPTICQLIPNHEYENENPWNFLIHPEEVYRRKNVLGQAQLALKKAELYKALGHKNISGPWGQMNTEILHATTRKPEAYDYEPSDNALLNQMLPIYLTAYLHTILLESSVCDEAARLMAMDNATHNADEMLSGLTREYKHLRQDKITTQTIQLMSGTMAG
ncbi:MAG: F0F1 ATP synthase subunit gamma, partial [Alphaproteobacteria bacterium]|nr:F0F1 ATP synthase subunit gamma [Alphaproteobacteria bacterium]